MEELFYELFQDMPQLGPGSKKSTLKALTLLQDQLPPQMQIADIGCGNGDRTILLANKLNCKVKAVDNYQDFLDTINKSKNPNIETILADMDNLPFSENEFDLIWSEGAVYIMGFEKGLKYWNKFLKPGGFVAVSELCWTTQEKPQEAVDFWLREYPAMKNDEENLDICQNLGYEVIANFKLPDSDWTDNYYNHLQKNINSFRKKYSANTKALEIAEENQKEINIFNKHSNSYGYVFYLLYKPNKY